MEKILVIETGGTFATGSVEGVRSLEHEDKTIYDYQIVKERLSRFDYEIEIMRPIYTLSENMTFEKLNMLIEELYKIDFAKYEGVIIIHGTDTMAYTANLLSMLFSNKGVPIVMVSANHPISMKESNGISNFIGAIDFIHDTDIQGVYVIYKNYSDQIEIHLGSRIKQMNQVIDAYESFKNLTFGVMSDGVFFKRVGKDMPSFEMINESKDRYKKEFKLNHNVLLIYPYVGLRYDYFNINENIDAIVCGVYHSGTVNSEDVYIDNSINKLIKQAEKYGIPIFLGELSSQVDPYESVVNISKSSVVNPIYDISLENLYVKVNLGLSICNNNKDLVNYVNDNIFFEKVVM